jgi:hypothetical protein
VPGREASALNGRHAYIDAMIDDNPTIGTAAIWRRLADDHGAAVAYYTLRTYVLSRRVERSRRTRLTETGQLSRYFRAADLRVRRQGTSEHL